MVNILTDYLALPSWQPTRPAWARHQIRGRIVADISAVRHWYLCCILLASLPLAAQTVTNSGQLIHLTPKAMMTVVGGMTNNGTFINNGSLAISGNWENRLTYNAGIGTFILNGRGQQLVNHNDQTFYTLRLDGSGEKLLQSHANVSHEFIFHEGILTPFSGKILMAEDLCQVTEGSKSSHVNGPFYQRGLRYKRYPIGKDGSYRPVVLEQINGVDPQIGFELFNGNVNGVPGPGILEVLPEHYWQKTLLTSPNSFQGALLTLPFESDDRVKNVDSLLVVEAHEPGSTFRNLGKEVTTGSAAGGTITSQRRITGQVFALGVVNSKDLNPNILYIPNAFSPGATLTEEKVWKVYGTNILADGLLLRIYNRWGELIFESQSLEEITRTGWQGQDRLKGISQSLGVYTYTLRGKFSDGKFFDKVGTISLIQ